MVLASVRTLLWSIHFVGDRLAVFIFHFSLETYNSRVFESSGLLRVETVPVLAASVCNQAAISHSCFCYSSAKKKKKKKICEVHSSSAETNPQSLSEQF
jgi:hypothetical protein